jgi:DNA-binding XRE family transcriptional regulator
LISDAIAAEARTRYGAEGVTQKQLAHHYGVSEMAMTRCLRGIKPPPAWKPCTPCARDRCTVHLPKTLGRRTRKVYSHGTNARYHMGGCRCGPCHDAALEDGRRRKRLRTYGKFDAYVDARPARDHLRRLAEAGIGPKSVSRACGVAASSLARIMGLRGTRSRGTRGGRSNWRPAGYRPIRRVRQSTLAKIMSVTVSDCRPPAGLMSQEESDLARDRVRDLIAHGVRRYKIAVYLDPDLERYCTQGRRPGLQLLRRRGRMTRKHFEAIERLYVAFFRARKQPTPEELRDPRAA